MNYLSNNTPYNFELKLNTDYNNIIRFLKNKEVQLALLGGITYAIAKEKIPIVPIVKPLNADGSPYYRSVIVAQSKNTTIRSIADLKDKSIAFPSKLSTSGYFVPLFYLSIEAGITKDDLSSSKNFRYHDSVVWEVLRGNFDAGAVIDSVADQYIDRGLKKVWTSPPIPGLPIVVRSDENPELVHHVKKALLALNRKNPEHCLIMDQLDKELRYGFTSASDKDYNIIRQMLKVLRKKGWFQH